MIRPLTITALLSAAALSACGLRGDLERPAPSGQATAAPRAGEGRAEGQDSRTSQPQADPVAAPTQPSQEGEVPPISRAPLEGTNDPIGRPPTTSATGPR